MPFRFLEHTADVIVECRAPTFKELLATGAEALYAIALKETRPARGLERTFEMTGPGREELLVRWLQELIFLLDVERFVASGFDFDEAGEDIVRGRLRGYLCEPKERAEEVKSATYHELEVRETEDGFVARVIFDL